jgi:hypothetical protein
MEFVKKHLPDLLHLMAGAAPEDPDPLRAPPAANEPHRCTCRMPRLRMSTSVLY